MQESLSHKGTKDTKTQRKRFLVVIASRSGKKGIKHPERNGVFFAVESKKAGE
jgi:hypothetical protein